MVLTACTNIQRSSSSEMQEADRATRIEEIDLELSEFWNNDWRVSQKILQTENKDNQPSFSTVIFYAMTKSKNKFSSSLKSVTCMCNNLLANLTYAIGPA